MEEQLNFFNVFATAAEETASAHLPSTMESAIPIYREMLAQYHAAMLAADRGQAARIEEEARKLALRLNGYEPGIIADDDSPGNVLKRDTAAAPGDVPLWGQAGYFVIDVAGLKVRVETKGLFGIGGASGFSANAVDLNQPFLSETGFRSFLGVAFDHQSGLAFDTFVCEVLRAYFERDLKGRLRPIQPRYRHGETLNAD